MHGLSFRSYDYTTRLMKKFKFSGAPTKNEAVIVRVISPYIFDKVIQDFKEENFVTLTIDSSNRKEVKLTLYR